MKILHKYLVLLVILPLVIFLGSCSKSAENEHLPEYCQTYSGFMATASKDLYDLIGDINRFNYLSAISEIELEFEVDQPGVEIDLDGIQCFQNLTSLTLIGQSFKDISPISALKNIQKIVLLDTSIVSIDSFKNLSKVNELTISNTKTLQSVDGVQEMTKLTRLDLSDNGIVNIDGLNNLVNLTELILSNNQITIFPSINQLELLETLDVSNNTIEVLGEDLSGLRNLIEFDAKNNNICDLSTLDDLTSLEILDLSENDLGCGGVGVSPDFSSLLNAPNLREIYLNDNDLSSIEDLRGKTLPLSVLHLENNNLTDITPIGNYTGIQELVLFNNNITDIDDLSGMTTVTEIDLSENSIVDFSDLLSIPNLETIDLSNNNITFIPDMSLSWDNLTELNLDSNNLIDTSGVEGHQNLDTLILTNNGMTGLQGISNLPLLTTLLIEQEIPDVIPEDFVFEDNPNNISNIEDSFNNLPLLTLTDETDTFDFGFTLGDSITIERSISDIEDVGTIDFSGMDIDFIDGDSINLDDLIAIDVSDNQLTSVAFVLNNPSLQILIISGNNISDLYVISGEDTSDLDNLDHIEAADITAGNDLLDAFIDLPELSFLDLQGTNITSIENCFNNLAELTDLGIDSEVLESIVDSFNNLYPIYTEDNIISFSDSKIGEIRNSFNDGLYEQISIQDNVPDFGETSIVDSFNNLDTSNINGIIITGNDFKTITGSFNDTLVNNLFMANNGIETITTSFDGTTVAIELNLQNNSLATLVGLNELLGVESLDLSNNALTTVAFLDGVTGLESLDISFQFDGAVTLNTIDGINNMPLLTEVIMDDTYITSIDGFKSIGITELILSTTDNSGGTIATITSTSFLASLITELDLDGHELDNIEFLDNFSLLTELTISTNLADLSGFQSVSFEGTLDSLILENIQDTTDFSYLSGYDALTFFDFESALTLVINNFNGLDSLTSSNFQDRANITGINSSFNDMDSLNLTAAYLDIFGDLVDITSSFDIYESSETINITGEMDIDDSFNNVGTVFLDNGLETSVLFDSTSFNSMHTISMNFSNHDSHAYLNSYSLLTTVDIFDLSKNIINLVNDNITSLSIANMNALVDEVTIDIADTGILSIGSNAAFTLDLTADNSDFELNSVGGTVSMDVDNTSINLLGELNSLTIDSANLTTATLEDIETASMTFNTNLLNQVLRVNTSVVNADTLNINSLSPTLSIDVRAETLNLYDNDATTYDLTVNGGDANIFNTEAVLTVDFTGEDLTLVYDTLESIDLSGTIDELILDSNNLDDIIMNNTSVGLALIHSEQTLMNISGTGVTQMDISNPNVTDSTISLAGADVSIDSSVSAPLNVGVTANSLDLQTINVPSITFDTVSSLSSLNLTDGTSIDTLTFNNANVTDTWLISNETNINITGTNTLGINLDADNLTDITVSASDATLDIDSLSVAISCDILATSVDIDSINLTDISLTNASILTTLNILNSSSVDNIALGTANIDNLNIDSDVASLIVSSVNSKDTSINGDSFIDITTDVGINDLVITSGQTSAITFDLTANNVDLTTSINTITIDNASTIDTFNISSGSLINVLGGSANIGTMEISESASSLNVTGSNLDELTVEDPLITTFDANVALATIVDFTTQATSIITITSTSEDITIDATGDVDLTSSTLISSTVEIGSNDITLNLNKPALSYTLLGTAGDVQIVDTSMNTFIVGAGLTANKIELTNDSITTLDLSAGTISNFEITSTSTAFDLTGNDLNSIILNMTNLDDVTINTTNINASLEATTNAASLTVDGTIEEVIVTGNNIASADIIGTTSNFEITSTNTTLNLLGNSLDTASLNMDNLSSMTVNSTNIAAVIDATTTASTLSVNGSVNEVNVVGNSLTSIDLNGTITDVDIEASSLTSADLTGATYSNLILDTDSLASLDTLTNVDTFLEVTTTVDDFDLTSNVPSIFFWGDITDNVNVVTTATDLDINTTNDSITIDGDLTDFVISGVNLNYVIGDAQSVDITNATGSGNFEFDLEATTVLLDSNNLTDVSFTGVNSINSLQLTTGSTAITTVDTNEVAISVLYYSSSGSHTTLATLATTINHTNNTTNEIEFVMSSDTQTINSNSEVITLSSSNLSSTVLNYSGANALSLSLNSLVTATINAPSTNTVNFDGTSSNVILSGVGITTIDTATLALSNKYTMNNTLVTDLEFVSASLLASLSEIEVDTLDVANVGSIITKLDSSGITLFSDIVSQDIYDYFYDTEHASLTDQEAIDTVRYTGFRDTAIADALAEFRLNTYFGYLDNATLEGHIDTQTYLTVQEYFDSYAIGEGYADEAAMVADNDQQFVDDIKASITATLGQPVLTIVELDLETSVTNSINDDSTTHATTESGSIGFFIG